MRNRTKVTSTRLNERRLRSIIREEFSKLKNSYLLKENLRYDEMAANYGATHYIDYDFYDEGEFDSYPVGTNIADEISMMAPEFDITDEDIVVLIKKSGPGGGASILRFYGDRYMINQIARTLGELEGDISPRTDLIKRISSRVALDT
jgi:hypothetical protein